MSCRRDAVAEKVGQRLYNRRAGATQALFRERDRGIYHRGTETQRKIVARYAR